MAKTIINKSRFISENLIWKGFVKKAYMLNLSKGDYSRRPPSDDRPEPEPEGLLCCGLTLPPDGCLEGAGAARGGGALRGCACCLGGWLKLGWLLCCCRCMFCGWDLSRGRSTCLRGLCVSVRCGLDGRVICGLLYS